MNQSENEIKAEQKPLDQRMQKLNSKLAVYPKSDHYVVDCFALAVQSALDRLPVYDHGRVVN